MIENLVVQVAVQKNDVTDIIKGNAWTIFRVTSLEQLSLAEFSGE
jgi:hypothetical protein